MQNYCILLSLSTNLNLQSSQKISNPNSPRIFQFINGIFRRGLDIEFVVIKLRNLENYERKKIGYP
jgi:hypothetical protein